MEEWGRKGKGKGKGRRGSERGRERTLRIGWAGIYLEGLWWLDYEELSEIR